MIKQVILIGCLAASAAEARTVRPARLAPSPFADTEASTNVPCALDLPSLKEYRIVLGPVRTPSNNVEVALGHDADGDGILSLDEAAISLAWDCGEWMARGIGDSGLGIGEEGEVPLVTGGPDTNGFVVAEIAVAVSNHKAKPAWGFNMVLTDEGAGVALVDSRGIEYELVIDEVVSKQLFKAQVPPPMARIEVNGGEAVEQGGDDLTEK